MKIALIVPTLNAGPAWSEWLHALGQQTARCQIELIIDSDSTDQTAEFARAAGMVVHQIRRKDFNHGATRQLGVHLALGADFLLFLTQDAILAKPKAIESIVDSFKDPKVGAAYGRQLPHQGANPIEAHARRFNYPEQSQVKSFEDKERFGIKTAFLSNSFAAYRYTALAQVGGFPSDVIFGEDSYVAAKMLMKGWNIAYCADAQVYHSHAYTFLQEFRRYFDVGVLHAREPWIQAEFGSAGGEGMRYVLSELEYLANEKPQLIPSALFRTGFKLLGYRLGKRERLFSNAVKRRLSMHKNYWQG